MNDSLLFFDETLFSRKLTAIQAAFPGNFTNISSYDDLVRLVNFNIPVPRDLNILFMGDSLTRYQYLDLAFFISRNGKWFCNAKDDPHFEAKGGLSWNSFYTFTDEVLRPYEMLCDCTRRGNDHETPRENRYFYDPDYNNRLVFLQKFGHIPFRTSWDISHINEHPNTLVNDPQNMSVAQIMNWTEAVENFVCNMTPKPAYFIFNSGWWDDEEFSQPAVQEALIRALGNCNIISVYKTTTIARSKERLDEKRERMCHLTDVCFNVSWTDLVPPEHYVDDKHFTPPLYSMINLHLLSMLASGDVLGVNS